MPKPKTAKLTLEILNDDGSKTIVTTEDLDASKLREKHGYRPQSENDPDHIVIGMKDPLYDEERDYFRRRNRWTNQYLDLPPLDTHFFMNLQLEPVKKNGPVYHIQKIEAPDTRVIMMYVGGEPKLCYWTEEDAQEIAARLLHMDTIYFFLDIPS